MPQMLYNMISQHLSSTCSLQLHEQQTLRGGKHARLALNSSETIYAVLLESP